MGFSFDGPSKVITLTSGTTQVSIRDLWSRWIDWFLTSDNSKFPIAFEQVGGNPIDATTGTYVPVYIFIKNDWKLKPQESNHTLNVYDGIIVVDGGGDPFIDTIGAFTVRIKYSQPVQAITVSTSGGGGVSLVDIENSSVLAKEETITSSVRSIKNHITAMTQ